MILPTKTTMKLANRSTENAQGIGIISFHFTNCTNMYVGTSLLLSRSLSQHHLIECLELYVGFQNVTSEPSGHCDIVGPQDHSWRSPYQTQNNVDCLKI